MAIVAVGRLGYAGWVPGSRGTRGGHNACGSVRLPLCPILLDWIRDLVLARLLLLFIVVPAVELVLLLWLADVLDWKVTVALIVITGVVGTILARSQGFRVWRRIQEELASGQMPGKSLVDAVMILIAGGLLVTPGVLTDLLGISLLLPPCRTAYRRLLARYVNVQFRATGFADDASDASFGRQFHDSASPPQDRIIDSYVVDRTEENET